MKKRILTTCILFFIFLVSAGASQAALWDRGGGLIYDDVLDVTWLQDVNYAVTSGAVSEGFNKWSDAMTWVDELEYYDSVRGVTYDDWRLPDTGDNPYSGWNIKSSEMGYMYYINFGGTKNHYNGPEFANGGDTDDMRSFLNLDTNYEYWTSTEFSTPVADKWAYYFYFGSGYQGTEMKSYIFPSCAWAVRDGDVASVPVPGAVWLMGSGLLGFAGLRRKFKAVL